MLRGAIFLWLRHWVLRVRLGCFHWLRLARLLWQLRLWWLRTGLRPACVPRSGVCHGGPAGSLYQPGIRHPDVSSDGFRETGLCDRTGCRSKASRAGSASRKGDSGGLCQSAEAGSADISDGYCHHCSNRAPLDSGAQPNNGADLLLDDSPRHDSLLRHQPVANRLREPQNGTNSGGSYLTSAG